MPPLDEILFLTALVVTLMLLIIAGAAIGVAIGNRLSPPDKVGAMLVTSRRPR